MAHVVLVLITVGGIIRLTPLHAFFRGLAWPHVLVTGGFCFMIFLGQFLGKSRETYPFTQWNMYCRRAPEAPARWLEITGRTKQGEIVRLDINSLQPALGHIRLRMRMNSWLLSEGQKDEETARRWLRHIALRHAEVGGAELEHIYVQEVKWDSPTAEPTYRPSLEFEVKP